MFVISQPLHILLLAAVQMHGPHITSIAAYERHREEVASAEAAAKAARKEKAAARKARKLAKQQVVHAGIEYGPLICAHCYEYTRTQMHQVWAQEGLHACILLLQVNFPKSDTVASH